MDLYLWTDVVVMSNHIISENTMHGDSGRSMDLRIRLLGEVRMHNHKVRSTLCSGSHPSHRSPPFPGTMSPIQAPRNILIRTHISWLRKKRDSMYHVLVAVVVSVH